MPGIEFLDPGTDADTDPAPKLTEPEPVRPPITNTGGTTAPAAQTPTDHRPGPVDATAIGLLVLAAGLAVLATFRLVYASRVKAGFASVYTSADGWGRLSSSIAPPGDHDIRYGVAICVAAGMMLLTAGLLAAGLFGRPAARRAATPVGIAAAALLAGVLASAALQVQSVTADLDARIAVLHADTADPVPPGLTARVSVGWLIWWGLLALACAVVALAVPALVRLVRSATARRRAGRTEARQAPPPAAHPDDEVLGTVVPS